MVNKNKKCRWCNDIHWSTKVFKLKDGKCVKIILNFYNILTTQLLDFWNKSKEFNFFSSKIQVKIHILYVWHTAFTITSV